MRNWLLTKYAYHSDPPFYSTSGQLVQAAKDTFDLYRAICSTAHKDLITGVPSIGMQYANDCRYIARRASEMCSSLSAKGKGRQVDLHEMSQTIERLRRYGDNVIEEQLVCASLGHCLEKILKDSLAGIAKTTFDRLSG